MRPEVGDVVTVASTATGYAKAHINRQVVVTQILESGSGVKVDVMEGYGYTFTLFWSEIVGAVPLDSVEDILARIKRL